jgi:hypothetical protein
VGFFVFLMESSLLQSMRTNFTHRKVFLTGCVVMFLLGVTELLGYVAANYLATKGALYRAQSEEGFEKYVARRHPVLGWVTQKDDSEVDAVGSRLIPAYPETENPCVSLYGDSFTWSSEVDSASAWSNQLSILLKCRVNNFGTPGYGSDQAYLKFIHNRSDTAPIVLLAHLSENLLRNVNRYAWLQYPGASFHFKPRFLAGKNESLRLLPPLLPTRDTFRKIIAHPENFLQNDAFVPGGHAGVQRFRFPYSWAVAKSIGHISVQGKLKGEPWFMKFYDPTSPTDALRVTRNILINFVKEARLKKKSPVVAIMPTGLDLQYFQKHRLWPYQPLLYALQSAKIPFINIGEGILRTMTTKNPCDLFDNCGAHFNETGYALVAKVVHVRLQKLVGDVSVP